jgi:site-specific recombinase XerD
MAIYQRVKRDKHGKVKTDKDGKPQRGAWLYEFTHKGKRYKGTIGQVSRTVAKEEEARLKAAVIEERLNPAKARKSPRLADFGKEYLAWYQANRKPESCRRVTRTVHLITERYGSKKLNELTSYNLEQYKKARKESGLEPSSVNLELTVFKALLHKAQEWGKLGEHPGRDVRPLKAAQGKTRFLSEDEEAAMLAVCSPELRRLIQAGLLTGFRRQELTSLRPEDVDLEHDLVSVAACYAKNGEHRTVPMTAGLKAIMQEALASRGHARTVFVKDTGEPWTGSTFYKDFKKACQRAGIENISPHILRHTYASRLVMAGVDLRTAQELMGHKDIDMTMRYAHLSPSHKWAAVGAMERHFSKKVPSIFTPPPLEEPSPKSGKVVALR